MKKLILLVNLTIMAMFTSCGYTNPEVPAGFEGYIVESPRFFGEGGYQASLKGPSNYGFSLFRNEAIMADMRVNTYNENFKILTKNKLNMSVRVQVLLSLKSGSIKELVDKYDGENWYARKVQRVFRSFVRNSVQGFTSGELKEKRAEVQNLVLKQLTEFLKGTPIILEKLVVGNIDFPAAVVAEIEARLAMEEKEKAKDIEDRIEEKNAQIRITEAKGIAKAQKIIDKSLTRNYLQYEAIKAQKEMSKSPNHTTIYIPVGNNGIPLMENIKK